VLEQLPTVRAYDRENLLLYNLRHIAGSPAWAAAALAVLADPGHDDHINQRDDRLSASLLAHAATMADLPLGDFRAAAEVHLPEFPYAAAGPIALLQAAGRYGDAATLADELAALIPHTTEHASRRAYLARLSDFAHAEQDAIDGTSQAPDNWPDDFKELPDYRPERHSAGRWKARRALGHAFPHPSPGKAADVLDEAATFTTGIDLCDSVTAYPALLAIGAQLLRWDAATRVAADTEQTVQHLSAARRLATVALQAHASLADDMRTWLTDVTTAEVDHVDGLLDRLTRLPAPLAVNEARPQPTFDRQPEPDPEPPTPVCVLTIDGQPITDIVILHSDRAYELGVELRLEAWPEHAQTCEVRLLSGLPADKLTVPSATFTAADAVLDEFGLRFSLSGNLFCGIERRPGSPPFDIPVFVCFRNESGEEITATVAGYSRLRVRTFDPTQDATSGVRQLDARLSGVLDRILDDPSLDSDDVAAFARFFTAIVRAAPEITFDQAFRSGKTVSEGQFHDELERRLREDQSLGGRLSRRDAVAGGFDDLLHDDIIAELKVEKKTPRTVRNSSRFLGQPSQYGVGRGSRLSILVILDHSRKVAPAGVLENYIGWVVPGMHGYDDPRYPSLVGVVIINSHWRLPSNWSRREIRVIEASAAETDTDPSAQPEA
jgi:hypothetical protein